MNHGFVTYRETPAGRKCQRSLWVWFLVLVLFCSLLFQSHIFYGSPPTFSIFLHIFPFLFFTYEVWVSQMSSPPFPLKVLNIWWNTHTHMPIKHCYRLAEPGLFSVFTAFIPFTVYTWGITSPKIWLISGEVMKSPFSPSISWCT